MRIEVRHFRAGEFYCPCCKEGSAPVAEGLVLMLELFRRAWGAPVRVNSGFRCTARNSLVGGALRSRHLIGCAADIAPVEPGLGALEDFKGMAGRLFDNRGWEFKAGPTYVHVAVPREERARLWDGKLIAL
ncbi:MAG: peptidase M15 [Fretibacterium sp.]|nr:peptidase M15 [Fretibacterium sp.]